MRTYFATLEEHTLLGAPTTSADLATKEESFLVCNKMLAATRAIEAI